jgi:hypothetical protein
MFDVTILLFSVRYRCSSIIASTMLSNEEDWKNVKYSWPREKLAMVDIIQHV